MRQFKSYNDRSYTLLRVGFVVLIIGFVLFKPLSTVLMELSEESVELSEDLSEEDSEKEGAENKYEFDWKLNCFESITLQLENEKDVTFGDQHHSSEFLPKAILQPPKC